MFSIVLSLFDGSSYI